jgi:hypothetical protein
LATPSTPISANTKPVIFRTPAWARYLSLTAVLILGAVSIFMLAVAVMLLYQQASWTGWIVAAVASFMAGLTGYVLRDLRGKWGLRVQLLPDRMVLDLPAGRSLIHRPVAQHLTIPYTDIDAIETRLEAYPSLGMEIMQRAYVLSGKHGERVFLFEDRALGSRLETPIYSNIATAITERARVPLRDLGMVEGRGGLLAVWGTSAPDWAAPSLPLAQQLHIWRHVVATGTLAVAAALIAVIIRLIAG